MLNRTTFKESLIDKLLIAIIASCVSTLAFVQYQSIQSNISFAQKNVDTYISYYKSNFQTLLRAVNNSIFVAHSADNSIMTDPLKIESSFIEDKINIQSVLPTFAFAGNSVGDHAISKVISKCLDPFNDSLSADNIQIGYSSTGVKWDKPLNALSDCRKNLIPAFNNFLGKIVQFQFERSLAGKSIEIGVIRLTWSTLVLLLILVAASGIAVLIYVRLPTSSEPSRPFPNQAG